MELVKAGPQMLEALIEIRLEYLRADFGEVSPQQEEQIRRQLATFLPQQLGRDFFAYVAVEGGEIAASVFMGICHKPSGPNYINGKTATLYNVYTKAAHRRKGLARQLVELAIADCKAGQVDYLDLQATADGVPLYQSMGFLPVEDDGHYTPMVMNVSK